MNLIAFLHRLSRRLLAGIVTVSLPSGAAGTALIAIIHRALTAVAESLPAIAVAFVIAYLTAEFCLGHLAVLAGW
jgi:ABC-type siderophore export system fused ATPase/permease subunit